MTIPLTNKMISELLGAALDLRGSEYVYEKGENGRCSYVRDGKPSCLVGVVLSLAGVPMDKLVEADNGSLEGQSMGAWSLLNRLESEDVIEIEYSGKIALVTAQCQQDGGNTWGSAVQEARKGME